MWKVLLLVLGGLALLATLAALYGIARWDATTRELHARLETERDRKQAARFDPRALEGLPRPVLRYLRTALTEGQAMVTALTVQHEGTFNMSESNEQWKPFTSRQFVVTRRPGFVWDGRITMMPGLNVRVHDAYVGGEGILHATLFGLVPLARIRGTPEVAEGELMRFLAESAWYPTALLPGQGVEWEAVDDRSANATLRDGQVAVTLRFRFGEDGLIESVRAEARGRTVGPDVIPTPWEGHWAAYEVRDGMRVPTRGEVAWILTGGARPYWRGRTTALRYEFGQ
jgi:hypothetical protein